MRLSRSRVEVTIFVIVLKASANCRRDCSASKSLAFSIDTDIWSVTVWANAISLGLKMRCLPIESNPILPIVFPLIIRGRISIERISRLLMMSCISFTRGSYRASSITNGFGSAIILLADSSTLRGKLSEAAPLFGYSASTVPHS